MCPQANASLFAESLIIFFPSPFAVCIELRRAFNGQFISGIYACNEIVRIMAKLSEKSYRENSEIDQNNIARRMLSTRLHGIKMVH